jgi:hypothetical protein
MSHHHSYKAYLIILSILISCIADLSAQSIFIGNEPESFVVKANESFSISGLTLIPDSDLDLSGEQIISTDTLKNKVAQPYLPLVYQFSSSEKLFTGILRLDYSSVLVPETITEEGLKLHYFDGTSWQLDLGSTVNTGTQTVVSSKMLEMPLGEITLSDNASILPVTWLSFTAEYAAGSVTTQWSTASEKNSKAFEVQSSTDALVWKTEGMVDAAGNSTTPRYYQFIHRPEQGKGTLYYRLLQRDLDGSYTLSAIRSVNITEGLQSVQMYPNPASHQIHLKLPSDQFVSIIQNNGTTVWEAKLRTGDNIIDVEDLPKGVYFVLTETQSYLMVKQ